MAGILSGIPNQANVADDILIGGTQEQHDKSLDQVLRTLEASNITLNAKKCEFDKEELSFLGLTFGKC